MQKDWFLCGQKGLRFTTMVKANLGNSILKTFLSSSILREKACYHPYYLQTTRLQFQK